MATYIAPINDMMFLFEKLRDNPHYNSLEKYKEVLKGASMVIMVATMLHSIATGNMLPANVKVIVVDINQATVTKLMDRGTWQALGIVSDAGAFLPMVTKEL